MFKPSRRFSLTLLLAAAGGACGSAPRPAPRGPLSKGTASLDVIVDKVQGRQGHVRCALFDTADGFPGPSPLANGNLAIAPADGAKCEFHDLPRGTYAVTVFHDANDSGVIDTNLFGAPTEGYGATKNHLPAAAAPSFAESSVALQDGQAATERVTLRY